MNETNEGYEIIKTETYATEGRATHSYVLGRRKTELGGAVLTQYVTWGSVHRLTDTGEYTHSYFWGHYFTDKNEALADFHRRCMEEYETRAASTSPTSGWP